MTTRPKSSGSTTKARKHPLTIDYMEFLLPKLRDPKFAARYLSAAYEEGEDVFLMAIRDVAEARRDMRTRAKAARLNGDPLFSTIFAILDALGLKVEFLPKERLARAA